MRGHLNRPVKVSLHEGCPFITGSLTWGRWDIILSKHPLIKRVLSAECDLKTGFTVQMVSLEDGFYCIECPLKTGFYCIECPSKTGFTV